MCVSVCVCVDKMPNINLTWANLVSLYILVVILQPSNCGYESVQFGCYWYVRIH